MTQLVNKSLVLGERMQGQEARYRILETIRQYASERLLEAGEGEQLRNRHLDFFLRWAERVEPELRGPQQLEWLDQLEAENDNLRAALEWSLTQAEDGEASLRLAGALPVFWYQRGYINEGLAWLEKVLTSRPPRVLAACGPKRSMGLDSWHVGRATVWGRPGPGWKKVRAYGECLGWRVKTGLAHALATFARQCAYWATLPLPAPWRIEAVALCRVAG